MMRVTKKMVITALASSAVDMVLLMSMVVPSFVVTMTIAIGGNPEKHILMLAAAVGLNAAARIVKFMMNVPSSKE